MRAFHIALPSGSLRVIRLALTSVAAGVGGRGGVTGQLVNTGALGVLGFRDGVFNELAGVYGESDKLGVTGVTVKDAPFATGVFGFSKSGNGIGVRGETVTGVGNSRPGVWVRASLGSSTATFGSRALSEGDWRSIRGR